MTRLATPIRHSRAFNVNSIRRRLPTLIEWMAEDKPDVMCLEETKVQDADFYLDATREAG
jgi:exodeoxyribonuclease-3